MKYIDAGKLKKYIENKRNVVCDGLDWEDMDECQRYVVEYLDDILSAIDSLQQEQLEGLHFTPLYRLIQKIPSKNWNNTINNYAKKLRDCLIKEGYLTDATVLQGYISYMNGNNVPMAIMDEQEQPEVDLKKEVKSYIKDNFTITDEIAQIPEEDRRYSMWEDDMVAFARHFYELGQSNQYQKDRGEFAKLKTKEWQEGYDEGYAKGLNARKEE